MGKSTVELAKSAVGALVIADLQILRFPMTAPFGFGVELLASRIAYDGFVATLVAMGLLPSLNRVRPVGEASEPRQYFYEVFVEVPSGWE